MSVRHNLSSTKKRRSFAHLREEYGDNCFWCGKLMLFDGERERPLSATIEHLVPRSEGGSNRLSNLRLAHRRCNEDRSKPTPRRCHSPFYVLRDLA